MNTDTLNKIRDESEFCSAHLHNTLAESKACKRSAVTDSGNAPREHESVEQAHISILRERCDELQRANDNLTAKVATIPLLILNARLDAKQGIQTKYKA